MEWKDLSWSLIEAMRANRLVWALLIGSITGLVGWLVIPHLPQKTFEGLAPAGVTTTTDQKSGDGSQCSNLAANGDGTVNCSASQEDKSHAPQRPKTP
jgi:hypothetical protein